MNGCYVYIIMPVDGDGPCKVGISEDPDKRAATLNTGSPLKLMVAELYWCASRQEAADLERKFHESHDSNRLHGEWFELGFDQANYWLFRNTMQEVFGPYQPRTGALN